jgi:hypothetical protein
MAVKLPEQVTDEQAIMISGIFPTAYCGADIAKVEDGDLWRSSVADQSVNSP